MISFINKNIQFRKTLVVLLFASIALNVSCKKALEVESSRLATEDGHWMSLQDTRSALMGTYSLMRSAMAENNAHWIWGELRNGDFNSINRSDLKVVINGDLKASFPLLQKITSWRGFYAVINSASLLIERAPEVLKADVRYTEPNYKVDVAQARALRAFAYFYMVRIWGDVPLITSSHDGSFQMKAKTEQSKVLAYAESELMAAAKDLPYIYGEENNEILPGSYYGYGVDRWRGALFTKISAYAILAHIAAWQSHYIDVAVYTDFIMTNYSKAGIGYSSTLQLTAADGIFNGQSNSQIISFSFNDVYGESTANGHIEELVLAAPLISRQIPDLYISKDTIASVFTELADQRFGLDTISGLPRTNYFVNYSGETPIFSKIKVLRGGSTDGKFAIYSSNLLFTRLEELVLLRAEALAVLNQRFDAITLLNIIKRSRGLGTITDEPGLDLVKEIFSERRRELMGEGWRWYDQIRYNKIQNNNPKFMNLINQKGIYWPIAKEVLNSNNKLEQNNYWK
ncbi:RagB/SusD family nutrient uptake outer membrane protein [Pedobacter frigoris]|uniref:RagB/SusD family nutrient uptake outer membrane protein n=1 Tax=Pedobacter frigoris TaxID=2571272 RepID=UPI0029300FE8|nr:RagB/SusD family nutrient uptake outer membrane protein [Pedobacter frigoris]